MKTPKKIKPLGKTSPHVWVLEPVHGCNLQCGHCCAELLPKDSYMEMLPSVWAASWALIAELSPTVRVDVCGVVGEPTLHPRITEFIRMAREISPLTQIQITTNGTQFLSGKVDFRALIDAGANVIYTDCYGPRDSYEKLAVASGVPWYSYYNKPDNALSPWRYWGPELKLIVLMDHPGTWPKSRFRAGLLGNWYGNLNWEKAAQFGMKPLEAPLSRRCNQPFLYVNVAADGSYLLCCQDGMHKTKGMFGSVRSGVPGFMKFWYGEALQEIRAELREKRRASMPFACAKCNITFSRCDYKLWTDEQIGRRV